MQKWLDKLITIIYKNAAHIVIDSFDVSVMTFVGSNQSIQQWLVSVSYLID